MRLLTLMVIIFIWTGTVQAFELGNQISFDKTDTHVGANRGTGDQREGGEDIASAWNILQLPFFDTGNTSDNIDDYDEECPYDATLSPDVVYSYVPDRNLTIRVDLCGSQFDTKTYIYDSDGDVVACNDDYYYDTECGQYVSLIEWAQLASGETYFIVVDAYGGDSGEYNLLIEEYCIIPCELDCQGFAEGEPPLVDDYVDEYNAGCGGHGAGDQFQCLAGNSEGILELCGRSGWYQSDGMDARDTDWFTIVMGSTGQVHWYLDAEEEVYGFLLGPNDCNNVGAIDTMEAGACQPGEMIITGDPGQVFWVWVGPVQFSAPQGFEGHEFDYVSTFSGLAPGTVATERMSFDGVKSLYR